MKKYLNNRANHKNLDLSCLFFSSKIRLIRLKRNVLKIIPYFVSAPRRIWIKHAKFIFYDDSRFNGFFVNTFWMIIAVL